MSKPKHHVRDSVCATRPPYREGRKAKAVKVYTVHQESQYLLVQGIPAVGAARDLIDLFTSHGEIAEHRMLDDYPADQFTEVCLLKYKKIQSARLAKRRFDDWSFYGGVLHVSYAPEYETIQETREKLQDRRKVIAAKVRQYSRDGTYEKNYVDSAKDITYVSDSDVSAGFQNNTNAATAGTSQTGYLMVHEAKSLAHMNERNQTTWLSHQTDTQISDLSTGSQPYASHTSEILVVKELTTDNQSVKNSHAEEQFWLPPPPKQTRLSDNSARKKNHHKFGQGPSAQATYPPDFDARTDQSTGVTLSEYLARKGPNAAANEDSAESTTKSVQEKIEENLKNTNVMIKNIPTKLSVPKFIPRQTQAKFKPKPSPSTRTASTVVAAGEVTATAVETDSVNRELRRNAFVLGRYLGPVELEEHTRAKPGPEESSIQKSVKQIREKLSQVTKGPGVMPVKDR